jgi:diguanylate cyclase (GGDEF)-like protein/PAS domain S-box-containing protein
MPPRTRAMSSSADAPRVRGGGWFSGTWQSNLLAPALFSLVLVVTAFSQFLLFHSLAELFAIGVAVTVFAVAWNTYEFTRNSFLVYLGCGYLWVAAFDLIHTLAYRGMGVFPVTGANLATQLWVAGRLFEAGVLLSATFILRRRIDPQWVLVGGGSVFLGVCALIFTGIFPAAYVEGLGLTPFKVGAEYIVILTLFVTTVLLWRVRRSMDARVNRLVTLAVGLTILAELVFTLYVEIISISMAVGHLLKFWSYWFIYIALVQFTLRNPFQILGRDTGAYDAFPEPTALVDRSGTIRQVNRALRESAGDRELVGQSCHALLHPRELARTACPVCQAIARATPAQGLELHYPDEHRWQEVTLTPFFWSRRVVGMVHVARDVSARHLAEEALAEELERARDYFNVAEVMLVALDPAGRITSVNRKAAEVTGWSEAEIIGREWFDMLPASEREEARDYFRQVLEGRADRRAIREWNIVTRNGHQRLTTWHSSPVRDNQGRIVGLLGSGEDITERRREEERLRQAAAAYEGSPDGVVIADANYRMVAVNAAFCRMTGFTETEILGRPGQEIVVSADQAAFPTLRQVLETQGNWQGEMRIRRKSGDAFPVWENISASRDAEGKITHFITVLTDISPLKAAEEKLDKLAHHDPLTGRPNRLLFHARVRHALDRASREATKVAVLFIDLDRFKQVNDEFGHEVGDRLLVETAARLEECVRGEDTVARIGGDEFNVLLEPLYMADDAGRVAQKIVHALHQPFHLDDHRITVGASVGISIFPEHGRDMEALIHNADVAMYRAKQQGRNNYQFFTDELTATAHERDAMEIRLRRALERTELVLHYQPQVEVGSGNVVGIEGLVRWDHPEQGMLLPERFIPLAEEIGLVGAIDEWVLRTACRQGRYWHDRGLHLRVAVNLSGKRFAVSGWVERLTRILAETGFDPTCLELEIGEGWLMANAEQTLGSLEALKALGITLVMDHFGTGYVSLKHLERFPLDKLKIAPAMIARVMSNENDAAVARATIVLGHTLDLTVAAIGVDNGNLLDFLRRPDEKGGALTGRDQYQGMLCQPPLTADALGHWLSSRPPPC